MCSLLHNNLSLFQIWLYLSVTSFFSMIIISGILFYLFYGRPTYDLWIYKINPSYPSPLKVKEEITTMLQGIAFSTICPSLSLFFVKNNWGNGYCGVDTYGYSWLIISFISVWFLSDFYEYIYHWLGHVNSFMWRLHKSHHSFYNPTPFAVIADSPIDQFFRAAPLFFFPLLFPVNIDMIFYTFSTLFFVNGLVQHSGFEFDKIDGHNKYILTSYHHYLHHAKSTIHYPIYNGQLFQIWDYLFQTVPRSESPTLETSSSCLCSKCCRARGERTLERYQQVEKPDYSKLMSFHFWWDGGKSEGKAN